MKKKYFLTATAIGVFMMTMAISAPMQAAQSQGDSSLQLGGSFFHAQGADVGTLNAEVSYGYFTSENLEIGFLQSLGYSFIDDADNEWIASTIPFVNYHFLGLSTNDSFQPFIGAFIGASYNDDDITGTLGPQIGFKSYISEKTFITAKYRYEWFFDELDIGDIEDESSDGNHVVTLGVGFLF